MQVYETRNMKRQFAELKQIKDYVLVPIFDVLFHKWIENVPKVPLVSDFQKECSERFYHKNERYFFVVDGKLVKVNISVADIEHDEAEDEFWYMVNQVSFQGNDEASQKLYANFKGFIKKQSLDELVKASKEELSKGKAHLLSPEMYNFYFR